MTNNERKIINAVLAHFAPVAYTANSQPSWEFVAELRPLARDVEIERMAGICAEYERRTAAKGGV